MKFILFVEGHTEHKAVPAFLKRWLDSRLRQPVAIKSVRFDGWAELVDDVSKKAHFYLNGSDHADVIAVISLLDLYGPTIFPPHCHSADDRLRWGKDHLEGKVNHKRFRHFFAVHETEAWLLSDPNIFPREIRDRMPRNSATPEKVNFNSPPAKLLDSLYSQANQSSYKKVVYGKQLFAKLDPDIACQKCPALQTLLNEMLHLAESAGLANPNQNNPQP